MVTFKTKSCIVGASISSILSSYHLHDDIEISKTHIDLMRASRQVDLRSLLINLIILALDNDYVEISIKSNVLYKNSYISGFIFPATSSATTLILPAANILLDTSKKKNQYSPSKRKYAGLETFLVKTFFCFHHRWLISR